MKPFNKQLKPRTPPKKRQPVTRSLVLPTSTIREEVMEWKVISASQDEEINRLRRDRMSAYKQLESVETRMAEEVSQLCAAKEQAHQLNLMLIERIETQRREHQAMKDFFEKHAPEAFAKYMKSEEEDPIEEEEGEASSPPVSPIIDLTAEEEEATPAEEGFLPFEKKELEEDLTLLKQAAPELFKSGSPLKIKPFPTCFLRAK